MLELGKAIRYVREAKGMRLASLAKRGGVSVPFLSLVENGERAPSLVVLRKLAAGLGIPSDVLIILAQPTEGNLQSNDPASRSLVSAIEKMLTVEDDLRKELGMEAKSRAVRKRNG